METSSVGRSTGDAWSWYTCTRVALCGVVVACFLWPYTFSFGAAGATFTLVNSTPYYLHVVVNNKTWVYVPPGGVVNHDAGEYANIFAEARYSPGQGARGRVARTFTLVYHTTTNYDERVASTCNSQGNDCDSSTEANVTVQVDPIVWTVTPSEFSPN